MKPRHVILAALSALLVFIGIRMATAPDNLSFTQTLELPAFVNLTQVLPDNLSEKVAVNIDGEPAFKNTEETQPTASTAKMILALMVMEKHPFSLGESGKTIEITSEFYNLYLYYVANGGSYTPVAVDEQISEYDALASALLPSSNNMADTLAIWAFGSLENYQTYATEKLREWGLTQTTIGEDASGFSETTVSSATDLAIIAQKLMQNPVLAEIVGKTTHEVPVAGEIKNTNQLLGQKGIIGVKTGFIGDPSGYCLVSAYQEQDHLITLAVLNAATRADSFSLTENLVSSLQQNLKTTEIAPANAEIGYYESWWGGKTPITINDSASVLAWSSASTSINLNMNPETPKTGTLDLQIGQIAYSFPVSADNLQEKPTLWDRFLYAIFLK